MKLTKLSHAVIAASLMTVGAMAHAEITTSGSVAFTTDYKFRGISQTSNSPAVQGSLTAAHDSGAYATVWGSSVDSLTGGSEMDFMLGYAGESGDISYDVGVMRYAYPGANKGNLGADPDYNEIYGSVSAHGAKVGVAYSDDYFAETGKFGYVFASYGTEVSGFGLSASVGYNKFFDDDNAAGEGFAAFLGQPATFTDDDYIDYKVAVSKEIEGIGFELAYIGTDLDEKDIAGLNVDGSVVVTASKSF
jgi:uncharacterized protein (TIGR02001 family)